MAPPLTKGAAEAAFGPLLDATAVTVAGFFFGSCALPCITESNMWRYWVARCWGSRNSSDGHRLFLYILHGGSIIHV